MSNLDIPSEERKPMLPKGEVSGLDGEDVDLVKHDVGIDDILSDIGLGKFHAWLFFICGAGWAADNMWMATVGLILPVVQAKYSISDDYIGLLGSAEFFGMSVGAIVWGALSDRIGRRKSFTITLLISGASGVLSSFSVGFWMLCIMASFIGFGVGGNMPVDGAIFSEFVPVKQRGRMMSLMSVFWPCGSIIAGLLGWAIISTMGNDYSWRILLGCVGCINLSMMVIRIGFPESPRFLLQERRIEEAEAVLRRVAHSCRGKDYAIPHLKPVTSYASLHPEDKEKATLKYSIKMMPSKLKVTTGLLVVIWFLTGFCFTAFNLFLVKLLKDVKHIEQTGNQYLIALVYAICGLPGSLVGAVLVESPLGRRWTMVISTACTAISLFSFQLVEEHWQVIVVTCLVNACSQSMFSAIFTYTPEVYPTKLRATGTGLAASASRVASVAAPYCSGLLFKLSHSVPLYVFGGGMLLAMAAMCCLPVETRGRQLAETATEDDID